MCLILVVYQWYFFLIIKLFQQLVMELFKRVRDGTQGKLIKLE